MRTMGLGYPHKVLGKAIFIATILVGLQDATVGAKKPGPKTTVDANSNTSVRSVQEQDTIDNPPVDDVATLDCASKTLEFNDLVHKTKYRVAVDAINGYDEASEIYTELFSTYLTATAGRRFDRDIEFEMVPMHFTDIFHAAKKAEIDFVFADPGIYSCLGVEVGVQPLATAVSRLEVRGITYDLDVYGGVIFTQADNDAINGIRDLREKVIGAGDISMLMAAQLQFYEMEMAGLSYLMDPKQVVFTHDQDAVVQGVLNRDFDVGFVRTDQIELSNVDPNLFKVIDPKTYVLDSGYVFPFLHSTEVFPEWPVASLRHVDQQITEEVQEALQAFQKHVDAYEDYKKTSEWNPDRCDTFKELSELATSSAKASHIHGFRTPRSYHDVRTMMQTAGFMQQDGKGDWHCTRSETLYEGIHCPEGHYKLPLDEYEQSCPDQGLDCPEGSDCFCKPCVKAHEVDVYELTEEMRALEASGASLRDKGCDKMSLCGSVEQTKDIIFHMFDNAERNVTDVEIKAHLATTTSYIPVHQIGEFLYEFSWSANKVGVAILEISFNGIQIPESPIRVQVEDRECQVDYPGEHKENNADGDCVCKSSTMQVGSKCVESVYMSIAISGFVLLVLSVVGYYYVRYRTIKADQVWHVSLDELTFDDPVEVIGQGSFGVVLLGEYRGTKVALKRAIKMRSSGSTRGSRSKSKLRARDKKDSTGLSGSVAMSDMGSSMASIPASDDEMADVESGNKSPESSQERGTMSINASQSGQGGQSQHNLEFLTEDFGQRKTKGWGWGKRNTRASFNETILNNSSNGSGSYRSSTWHDALCPWFSDHSKNKSAFISEMRVLSRLRHPCITTVMGAVLSSRHDPMLVMEYMEYGSLKDLLQNETMYLSGDIIMQICRDLAQGLRFLHSSRPQILHGDLKGRNILIDARFRAKLCDFGLSTKKTNVITGTPYWMAPEYLRGQTDYTAECDIYSVGIVLYEIYSRSDPYKGEDFRTTLRKICDRRANKRPPIPEMCPPKFAELMKKCWSHDPQARPQARALDTMLLDMSMQEAEPLAVGDGAGQKPTGDMLYQLFPKHIADVLKSGQKVEPEQHDEVTVIFSDIVHFTDISRTSTPLKVSNMLDRLYLAFDKVARKHNVFKVETIGDAYMGVTNLEKDQKGTHARNAALFAIDLIVEASKVLIDDEDPSKGYINIRVGFHSGPVVSNVIGSLNPRYGLFGDTVNTSSRMESNSKANRILCSEASYKILTEQAPEISAKKRGRIAVKGKGDMDVYWIGHREVSIGRALDDPAAMDLLPNEEPKKKVAFNDESHSDLSATSASAWRNDLKSKFNDPEFSESVHDEPEPGVIESSEHDHAPEQAPPLKIQEVSPVIGGVNPLAALKARVSRAKRDTGMGVVPEE